MQNADQLGALERRLNLVVPVAEVDAEVDVRLKRLSRTVKMQGFRPGKVPLKLVAQQHGGQVRQEVLSDRLQQSFSAAVEAQQLRVAGYPRIEPLPASTAEALEFAATFEVYPDVKLGDYSAATLERPQVEVGEADIDRTLETLRKQRVSYAVVERAAADGDQVQIDYTGQLDGVEFPGGKGEGVRVVLGNGRLLKDFESQVTGLKAGDSCSFDLTFPADYHAAELAGKTARFDLTLREVAEARLPELDAEFARALGITDGDVGRMRQEVRENVEREVKNRVQAKVKEQVMEILLKSCELDLPQALIGMEIERMMQQMVQDMQSRGMDPNTLPFKPELFEEQARRRVKLGLILAELVKSNGLFAKPEQVRARVEEFAQSYETPEDVVRWYYAEAGRLADVEALALEDNVVGWLVGKLSVTEKALSVDELMGASANG